MATPLSIKIFDVPLRTDPHPRVQRTTEKVETVYREPVQDSAHVPEPTQRQEASDDFVPLDSRTGDGVMASQLAEFLSRPHPEDGQEFGDRIRPATAETGTVARTAQRQQLPRFASAAPSYALLSPTLRPDIQLAAEILADQAGNVAYTPFIYILLNAGIDVARMDAILANMKALHKERPMTYDGKVWYKSEAFLKQIQNTLADPKLAERALSIFNTFTFLRQFPGDKKYNISEQFFVAVKNEKTAM